MRYQIIGDAGTTIETKSGKHVRSLCVLDPYPPKDWRGIKAEILSLWDATLEVTTIDTLNGKLFDATDDKDYYIDVDYNKSGWIIAARVHNG